MLGGLVGGGGERRPYFVLVLVFREIGCGFVGIVGRVDGLNVELNTNYTQSSQQDEHRDLLNDLNTEVSTILQTFINNDFLDRDHLTLNHFNNLTL